MDITKKEVYEQLYRLRCKAEMLEANFGSSGKYEWEIGANIKYILLSDLIMHTDQPSEIFGIPIGRVNMNDTYRIKLWVEVE